MNTDDTLIQHARARFDHITARKLLKEKYEAKLLFTDQGGLWRADPIFIQVLTSFTEEFTVILLDQYGIPTQVNRWDLLAKARKIHASVMDAWYAEYTVLDCKQ